MARDYFDSPEGLIDLRELRWRFLAPFWEKRRGWRHLCGPEPKQELAKFKFRLFVKQKGRCAYCLRLLYWPLPGELSRARGRRSMKPPALFTVDHVVPRRHGGTNQESNLVAACWTCNSSKCARAWTPRLRPVSTV